MKPKHIFVLIAMCGLAATSIGVTMNCAGVFYGPIAEDLGVGRGSVAMMVTITSIVASVVAMFVPKKINEKNLKMVLIVATALLAGMSFLISVSKSVFTLYLFSFLRGIGDGMINFVLITMIVNFWFYANRGVFTSVVMACSGVPGVILSPILTNIINASGWRTAFVYVAIFSALFCLPAILLPISIRPEATGEKPYGYEEYLKAKEEGKVSAISGANPRFNFLNPKFLLMIIVCIATSVVAAVPQHLPGYAVSLGKAASVGALMLSVTMACNIASKIVFGILNDKLGSYKAVYINAIVNIIGIVLLLFIGQEWALYIGSGMYATTFAVSAVGMAMLAGYLFGMEYYGTVYPIISFIGGIANAVAITILGSIYDATGAYSIDFWIALVCQILLIVCTMLAVNIRHKERRSGIENV